MKKILLLVVAFCCSIMSTNATLELASIEESAWANLSTTDFASNNYTGEWGRLKVVNHQLCSENGNPIQLRGWSTYSINYDEVLPCLAESGFDAMKAWGANIVRLAIYPKNSKGSYSESENTTIEKYISYASQRNMYVLIDWHVSDDDENSGNPETYKSEAKQMFFNITNWVTSNGYKNVLYEICNECSDATWLDIKSYANEILPIIQTGDKGAVVIVGTPQKNQNIGDAVNSPIDASAYQDLCLMYAFHYNACSKTLNGNNNLLGCLKRAATSLPCFITQWSSSYEADSLGTDICTESSNSLLSTLQPDGNNGNQLISWCYWAWGQKNVATNCLCNCAGGFSDSSLTAAGKYIVPILTGESSIPKSGTLDYYAIQDIPLTGQDYGVLNVGWFDYGGEGVAYHDDNSTKYSTDGMSINYSGTEHECSNAGAVYSGKSDYSECFRYDSDVDVNHDCAGLGANWGEPGDGLGTGAFDLHSLCVTNPGEWILYRINVQKAGYYTVKCMTNSSVSRSGTIGMAIAKSSKINHNGNIIRRWSDHDDKDAVQSNPLTSFALIPTPSCGLMYDGSINVEGAAKGEKSQDWTCWGWTDCGTSSNDLTVLFKYTGEQELQITISPDSKYSPGEFSNFAFTLKSEEIPDFEYENTQTEVENVLSDDVEFTVAPNPTDGQFYVKVDGKANLTISNIMGVVVYDEFVDGSTTVNKKLSKGIYIVRVGNKTKKLIVL